MDRLFPTAILWLSLVLLGAVQIDVLGRATEVAVIAAATELADNPRTTTAYAAASRKARRPMPKATPPPTATMPEHKLSKYGCDLYEDFYRANSTIDTLLGKMSIEARVEIGSSVSQKLHVTLDEFVRKVLDEQDDMLNVVFSFYKLMEADDELQGVPPGLSSSDLITYLHDQYICVADPLVDGDDFDCFVYIRPEWEEEHCIYLRCIEGKWELTDPC